ncbi:flagellar hook-associated protein FlgL [Hydrogenophaga aquatica]
MSYFRVSTAHTYDSTISRITQRTAEVSQMQEKLSAGKRVLRATDDPVAATMAEREANRLMRVEADMRALERSRASLEQAEGTVGQAADMLHRVKELIVQAGNTGLSNSDRLSISSELRGLREQLLNLANTQDSEGSSLFGGLGVINTSGKAFADVFSATQSTVVYQAIPGQATSSETGLPNRVDGDYALMRNLTGNGVFAAEHVSGSVHIAGGGVFDQTAVNGQVFPYDGAVDPQGRYELEFVEVPGAPSRLEIQVTQYDKGTGTSNVLTPNIDLGEYVPGTPIGLTSKSVQFEGIQVTLTGSATPGARLAIHPSEPDSLFATLTRTIDALENSGATDGLTKVTQALNQAHQEIATGLDRLLLVRGRLGEWLRRADSLDSQLQDRSLNHEKQLSNLTDLDMVKAISQFQMQQLGLQAALQSYGQVQKLSLFQYIA